MRYKPAFTLVEILVALTLFAVLSAGLAGVMVSGFKLWSKVKNGESQDVYSLIEIERMSRDLRECLAVKELPFNGSSSGFECPIIENGQLAKASYFYDEQSGVLSRASPAYQQILDNNNFGQPKSLIRDLNVTFSYLARTDKSGILWQDSFDSSQNLPLAVKIILEKSGHKTEKVVFIPAGS
jgi:prepilin-type N-terminal cleavage/methylation domain-containing protein